MCIFLGGTSRYRLQIWLCSLFFLHKPWCTQDTVAMGWHGTWASQFLPHCGCILDERKQAAHCTKTVMSREQLPCLLHCLNCAVADLPHLLEKVSIAWKQKYNLSRKGGRGMILPWTPAFFCYVLARSCCIPAWVGLCIKKDERYERGAFSFREFFFMNIETWKTDQRVWQCSG